MLEEFGVRICAYSLLCVREDLRAQTSLPIDLTGYAWQTLIPKGIRIDISKVRSDAILFYMRKIGQWFVRDSFFPFGKWNVMCGLIVYPANPLHPGAFSKQFEGITAPCNLAESKSRHLYIDSPKEFLRACRSTPYMGHQTP